MKNARNIWVIPGLLAVMLFTPILCLAQLIRPLTEQEKAELGATHEVQVVYTNLTTATTNTAQTLTVNVKAKYGVDLVAMVLKKAFDTSNTNFTGSLAVTVGDGNDADRFLQTTELASDGTEVWVKFGRGPYSTDTTFTLTNVVGTATSLYTVVSATAITSQNTLYTGADTVDFTFTPNAEEAVGSNTVGEVLFYLKILDAALR